MSRPLLISKLQDVYHYLLAATGELDSEGRESTFDHGRLVQRLENYDFGRDAFIDAHDIADGSPDEASEEQRREVLDSPRGWDFRDEAEMKAAAKTLFRVLRDWCKTIEVDPYQCFDIRTGRHY